MEVVCAQVKLQVADKIYNTFRPSDVEISVATAINESLTGTDSSSEQLCGTVIDLVIVKPPDSSSFANDSDIGGDEEFSDYDLAQKIHVV
jgi:hypothetical protein